MNQWAEANEFEAKQKELEGVGNIMMKIESKKGWENDCFTMRNTLQEKKLKNDIMAAIEEDLRECEQELILVTLKVDPTGRCDWSKEIASSIRRRRARLTGTHLPEDLEAAMFADKKKDEEEKGDATEQAQQWSSSSSSWMSPSGWWSSEGWK